MPHAVAAEMAPTGKLRVAINMRNPLLVTSKTESGAPVGVAASLGKAFAEHLGVPLELIPYAGPGELADAAAEDLWDIGLIGADPARGQHVYFTAPYCEIEATYLVPEASPFKCCSDVDSDGVRIAVCARAAYDLWLERNIKHATVHRAEGHEATYEKFAEGLEACAGLRSKFTEDMPKLPGMRLMPDRFMAVEQAACTKKARVEGFQVLSAFFAEAKASGLVQKLIDEFGVTGKLTVAG